MQAARRVSVIGRTSLISKKIDRIRKMASAFTKFDEAKHLLLDVQPERVYRLSELGEEGLIDF